MTEQSQDRPGLTGGLALVGAGKIGEALLAGLLAGPVTPEQINVVETQPDRARYLRDTYGVHVAEIGPALDASQTVVIAVKPHDVDALLRRLDPHVREDHLVVSVAAGVSTAQLEGGLNGRPAVVRCMPNTAAVVGEAMTAIAAGANVGPEHLDRAEALLRSVGKVVRVAEYQLDAVTALSGSGPAYFFYLVEALIDAGVLLGLPRTLAAELVVQTAAGAALLLRDSGDHPVLLREAVSSPAGTTIAGVRELERHGVRSAVFAAAEAARDRSVELGRATEAQS